MEQIYRVSNAATNLMHAHAALCERVKAPRSFDPYGIQVVVADDQNIEVLWAKCTARIAQRVVRSAEDRITLEYAFFVDIQGDGVCIGALYMDAEGIFWQDAEQTVQMGVSGSIDSFGRFVAKKMLQSEAFTPLKLAPC